MLIRWAPSRLRNSTGVRSMFPQSRSTRVLSTRSAGGSWKTSSSGRKRYSTGSGNSFAERNMTESLPSWVRMPWSASSEPSASPSGPSWVVSRNRCPARSSSATAASWRSVSSPLPVTVEARSLIEHPRQPHGPLGALVVVEAERRRALDPQLPRHPRLQHAVRRAQRGERRLALGGVAEHAHEHARGAQVGAGFHCGHGHESDPGILELGSYGIPDHLAHDRVHASHALGHGPPTIAARSPPPGPVSVAQVRQREQVALERAPVWTTRLDEALQLVRARRHPAVADQRAQKRRPLPGVVPV